MLGWQSILEDHLQVICSALEELVDVRSRFLEIGFCWWVTPRNNAMVSAPLSPPSPKKKKKQPLNYIQFSKENHKIKYTLTGSVLKTLTVVSLES